MKTFKTLRQIIEAAILTMFPMLFICIADFFILEGIETLHIARMTPV